MKITLYPHFSFWEMRYLFVAMKPHWHQLPAPPHWKANISGFIPGFPFIALVAILFSVEKKGFSVSIYYTNVMTSSQINDTFLFHRVIKILTGGRILQISIARCQIEAEIHSFPTMYGKGGGRCGKNWRNQGFRPKVMPKTRFFWGHKSGSSHFRVAWGPLFQRWCQFRYVPQKIWVKSFQMSYGHVR